MPEFDPAHKTPPGARPPLAPRGGSGASGGRASEGCLREGSKSDMGAPLHAFRTHYNTREGSWRNACIDARKPWNISKESWNNTERQIRGTHFFTARRL